MEEGWAQQIRALSRIQKEGLVDAKITDDHRLSLRRRDGQEIDAGPIKVKPPGAVVALGNSVFPTEPDVYGSLNGILWTPGASPGRFHGGTNVSFVNCGCWTGDRFLVPWYVYSDGSVSSIIQSRDGGTWTFHPDNETFNNATNGNIFGMDADEKTGTVVVVGQHFGASGTGIMAVSHDFGDTWEVFDSLDLDPPLGALDHLCNVCVKNQYEWIISTPDYGGFWYTYDGGVHWNEVVYPVGDFVPGGYTGSGMRFFRGYWWLFGQGYGHAGDSTFDTPLIRSKDLKDWEPVITPWSGIDYPPRLAQLTASYAPDPPPDYGNSGIIENLEYDPVTNTVIANGFTQYSTVDVNGNMILISDDGGEHFFEVGYSVEDYLRTDYGWDGVYNWPLNLQVAAGGGMAFAYGWWFVSNFEEVPDGGYPSLIRISPDGQITEPVYLPLQQSMTLSVVLAGGDRTF